MTLLFKRKIQHPLADFIRESIGAERPSPYPSTTIFISASGMLSIG